MTIFVDVLKKLIRGSLTTVSRDLGLKKITKGYNHALSGELLEEISKLEEAIILFKSTGNDDLDSKSLAKLVTDTCNEVKSLREKHRQLKDSGTTVPALNTIILRIPEFYDKLVAFKPKFNLLNKKHSKTPDDIVYFNACSYLGEDVFNPKPTTNVEVRIQKENKLAERLCTLSELIKPTYTLEQNRERVLRILTDLEGDNVGVTKGSAPSLPSISVFGIFQLGSPSEWFAPSAGRLAEWIDVARAEIAKLTPETSDCPLEELVVEAPRVPAKKSKEEEAVVPVVDKGRPKAVEVDVVDEEQVDDEHAASPSAM